MFSVTQSLDRTWIHTVGTCDNVFVIMRSFNNNNVHTTTVNNINLWIKNTYFTTEVNLYHSLFCEGRVYLGRDTVMTSSLDTLYHVVITVRLHDDTNEVSVVDTDTS